MFDIEKPLADWRAEILRDGRCAKADLAELEEHLRESMMKLSSSGLSEEEAFLVAARRLGGVDQLRSEYGKTYPERVWRERAVWMLVALVVWPAIQAVLRLAGVMGLIAATSLGAKNGVLAGISNGVDILGWVGAFGMAWLIYRQAVKGRIGRWPGLWIACAVLVIVVGRFGAQVEAIFITPHEMGHQVVNRMLLDFGISILVPIVFGILALWLWRKVEMESC